MDKVSHRIGDGGGPFRKCSTSELIDILKFISVVNCYNIELMRDKSKTSWSQDMDGKTSFGRAGAGWRPRNGPPSGGLPIYIL